MSTIVESQSFPTDLRTLHERMGRVYHHAGTRLKLLARFAPPVSGLGQAAPFCRHWNRIAQRHFSCGHSHFGPE
jgi:hypothetical protein